MPRDPVLSLRKNPNPVVPEVAGRTEVEEWWPMVEVAQLRLYADNPFRVLGLRAFAAPGEIVRRVDDLVHGVVACDWAFAPRVGLSATRLGDAAQTLKGGLGRLFSEFFWFWPENYPAEKSDPAIDALARGDPEAACDIWETALAERRGVAAHNLAVLFHLAALDRELAGAPLDEEARDLWRVAAEHWKLTLADDEIWARLESRLKRFDDPRVPADFAGRVRAALPAALCRIHALGAAMRLEKGASAEAALHVELARETVSDAEMLRRGLQGLTDPLLDAIEAAARKSGVEIAKDAQPCLPLVEELLRSTAEQRRIARSLDQAGFERARRTLSQVVETATIGLKEHRRRSRNHAATLPWLVHLATLPATPEVATAVVDARNAALSDATTVRLSAAKEADPAARLDARLQLIEEILVPAGEGFDWWPAQAVADYRQQVAALLSELAKDAFETLDEFDLSSRAFGLAAEIAGAGRRAEILKERRSLWCQFMRRHKEGMCIEHEGHVLEIDACRVIFGGQTIPIDEITRLRFGSVESVNGRHYSVAWCAAKEVVELDSLNLLAPDEDTEEIYQLVVETLDVFVLPVLTDRLVARVRAGESVVVGNSALRPEGFVFCRRLAKSAIEAPVAVPYAQITCNVQDGELVVVQTGPAPAAARFSFVETWNAVILADVIKRLATAN